MKNKERFIGQFKKFFPKSIYTSVDYFWHAVSQLESHVDSHWEIMGNKNIQKLILKAADSLIHQKDHSAFNDELTRIRACFEQQNVKKETVQEFNHDLTDALHHFEQVVGEEHLRQDEYRKISIILTTSTQDKERILAAITLSDYYLNDLENNEKNELYKVLSAYRASSLLYPIEQQFNAIEINQTTCALIDNDTAFGLMFDVARQLKTNCDIVDALRYGLKSDDILLNDEINTYLASFNLLSLHQEQSCPRYCQLGEQLRALGIKIKNIGALWALDVNREKTVDDYMDIITTHTERVDGPR